MRSIYKYPLRVVDEQTIEMPFAAQILSVQVQFGVICLWALVDTDERKTVERRFHIFGTGHPIADSFVGRGQYLGTVQLREGALVFHIYEEVVRVQSA